MTSPRHIVGVDTLAVIVADLNDRVAALEATPPTPPSALTLTATAGDTEVTLSVSGGTGATSYALYRSATVTGSPIATSFPFTDTGLTNGTSVTYVATATNAGGTVTSNTASATPHGAAQPSDVSGLVSWFKADAITGLSDGNAVGTWPDSSTTAGDATQATSANRPLYKTNIVNSLPVVRFADTTDSLAVPSPGTYSATTIFAVVRAPGSGDYAMRRGVNNGDIEWRVSGGKLSMDRRAIANVLTGTTTLSTTNFSVVAVTSNNTTNTHAFYVNGAADGSVSGGNNPDPDGAYEIGVEYPSGNFDIAEIIVYDNVLSGTDRADITAYLGDKYAISVV